MTLLAHWPIDDGLENVPTTARDIAAGGSGAHTGTYQNLVSTTTNDSDQLVAGGVGGMHLCAHYNANIDSVLNPSDLRLLGSLTIVGWFWNDHYNHAGGSFAWYHSSRKMVNCSVTDGGTSATNNCYLLTNTSRNITLSWQNGLNNTVTVTTVNQYLKHAGPNHIACVRYFISGSNYGVRFYVDGNLVEDLDNSGSGWLQPDGGSSALPYIGRDNVGDNGSYPVRIDSVRIYDEELADEDVDNIYTAEYDEVHSAAVDLLSTGYLNHIGTPADPYLIVESGPFSPRDNAGWGQVS